jgi:hypothetical protein
MDEWQKAYHEEVERRLNLARRVGFLEGTIKLAAASLDAGADGDFIAKRLRKTLAESEKLP